MGNQSAVSPYFWINGYLSFRLSRRPGNWKKSNPAIQFSREPDTWKNRRPYRCIAGHMVCHLYGKQDKWRAGFPYFLFLSLLFLTPKLVYRLPCKLVITVKCVQSWQVQDLHVLVPHHRQTTG